LDRPLHMYTFHYEDWSLTCRRATVQNGVFVDTDTGDHDAVLNYRTWSGQNWSAKIDPVFGGFLHSQDGFGGAWHADVILNYRDCSAYPSIISRTLNIYTAP
ncbi:MAG: hypothetical protein R3330_16540, partial [Saprospiraceae bacterium]|nr:hypothetical protein [Saprospiraceae bacterium]